METSFINITWADRRKGLSADATRRIGANSRLEGRRRRSLNLPMAALQASWHLEDRDYLLFLWSFLLVT